MNNIKIIILTIVCLFSAGQLSAQAIINNDPAFKNRAYLGAGIEPATMLTLGYERKFELHSLPQNLVAYAEYGVSVANLRNYELKAGGILPVFQRRNFMIVDDLNVSTGSLSAKNFDSNRFALGDELAFGIY